MRFRKLRIAWSMAWGLAAVLLVVLWVRSYSWINSIAYESADQTVGVWSDCGSLLLAREYKDGSGKLVITNHRIIDSEQAAIHPTFGFEREAWGYLELCVPHWFVILLFISLAAASWFRWRFTLRTLLIATTLVAVGLGLIVWQTR